MTLEQGGPDFNLTPLLLVVGSPEPLSLAFLSATQIKTPHPLFLLQGEGQGNAEKC